MQDQESNGRHLVVLAQGVLNQARSVEHNGQAVLHQEQGGEAPARLHTGGHEPSDLRSLEEGGAGTLRAKPQDREVLQTAGLLIRLVFLLSPNTLCHLLLARSFQAAPQIPSMLLSASARLCLTSSPLVLSENPGWLTHLLLVRFLPRLKADTDADLEERLQLMKSIPGSGKRGIGHQHRGIESDAPLSPLPCVEVVPQPLKHLLGPPGRGRWELEGMGRSIRNKSSSSNPWMAGVWKEVERGQRELIRAALRFCTPHGTSASIGGAPGLDVERHRPYVEDNGLNYSEHRVPLAVQKSPELRAEPCAIVHQVLA